MLGFRWVLNLPIGAPNPSHVPYWGPNLYVGLGWGLHRYPNEQPIRTYNAFMGSVC